VLALTPGPSDFGVPLVENRCRAYDNHRWHIWSLDVDGVRVVVLSEDFAGTSPEDLDEMHAVIESIRIGS